jgi:RimJ/RimL family protein N-acetyltransferase
MGKRYIAPIYGKRTRLRLLKRSDLLTTLRWRNQDHIRKWFVHSDIIEVENHFDWYDQYRVKDNDFVFIIEETQILNRPIGQVSLYNIDWGKKRSEFGRLLIGENEASGLGLGKEASLLLVTFAKRNLGIDSLYLEVFSDNLAAKHIYLDMGFVEVRKSHKTIFMELNLRKKLYR